MNEKKESKMTAIASLVPGMKNVNVQFIVLETGPVKRTKDNHEIRTMKVADHSGMIDMAAWDEIGEALRPSFICRVMNGHTQTRAGCLSLAIGKYGDINKIGEITMAFSEVPNMSLFNADFEKKELEAKGGGGFGGNSGGGNGGNVDDSQHGNHPNNPVNNSGNNNKGSNNSTFSASNMAGGKLKHCSSSSSKASSSSPSSFHHSISSQS